jgi:glycosyltransferase involved in cell wall biosynthesis
MFRSSVQYSGEGMSNFWLTLNLPLDRRRVLASDLFDAQWYRQAHPYVVRDKVDPLTHFLKYGGKHRLSPSRAFDTARYLDEHEDARQSRLNPLVHYLKRGRARGLKIHAAPPSAADRIVESGLFDSAWYLEQYSDVAAANYPPLLHYLVYGALEGRSPGPDFDAGWYLSRYPDITGTNPLLHYIDHGRAEGRLTVRPHNIFALAQETVAGIEDLDPELYSFDFFDDAGNLTVVDGRPHSRVTQALEAIVAAIEESPKAIVFLPWLVHGGADLVACHAVRAMAETHGLQSVLVILADHNREEALHLLPKGVTCLSFSQTDGTLSLQERIELIDVLVRSLQPAAILNVNSYACWEAIKRHGWRLTHFTRLYAMLFCPDFSESGRRSGYSDLYLRHCLPVLSGIYFDNQAYIDELVEQFHIPADLQSRLVSLHQPAPVSASGKRKRRDAPDRPLQVLWAGRFTAQKNVDLLIRIVQQAPQFVFHIWGRGSHALEVRLKDLARRCDHVHFHGPFERFDALPVGDYDALLYTSLWDGLPNILLEAAGSDLAIVSSHVGGIGELVDRTTGWLIDDIDDPHPYVEALHAIADDSTRGQAQTSAMRKRLHMNHNWDRYRETLSLKPLETKGFLHVPSNDHGDPERPSRGDASQAVA